MWAASSSIDCVSLTATSTRYGDNEEPTGEYGRTGQEIKIKSAIKNYWKGATQTEGLILIFLYFAAYLTGIGALLDRLRSPSDDAANESDPIAVQVVYWVLLAFYSLVPVAGCAWFGLKKSNRRQNSLAMRRVRSAARRIRLNRNTPSGWSSSSTTIQCSPSSRRSKRNTSGASCGSKELRVVQLTCAQPHQVQRGDSVRNRCVRVLRRIDAD